MTDPVLFRLFVFRSPPLPQVYRAGIPALSLDLSCFSWIAHVCLDLSLLWFSTLGIATYVFQFSDDVVLSRLVYLENLPDVVPDWF